MKDPRPSFLIAAILVMAMIVLPGCASGTTEDGDAGPGGRTFTFKNVCPFPVWIKATGGNASNKPCQTGVECPDGQQCDGKNCYCTADAQCSGATKCLCPPSNPGCPAVAKKCRCTTDADCGPMQGCNAGSCFWMLPESPRTGGWKLGAAGTGGETAVVVIPAGKSQVVWSGNIGGATGCNDSGVSCTTGGCDALRCSPGVGQTPPATLAEFTLQKAAFPDTYDVELINGFNIPVEMSPDPGADFKDLPTDNPQNKNFWCGNPGGDAPRSPVSGADMTGWPSGGCPWKFTPSSPAFVKVKDNPTGAVCTGDSGCTTPGELCGVSLEALRDRKSTDARCGAFLGYWSAGQACSYGQGAQLFPPFNCSKAVAGGSYGTVYHLYLCDLGDSSPSCYSTNSTTCCGCADWNAGGTALPTMKACLNKNPDWTADVKPSLDFLKEGCPMCYIYPYDDPPSTFTCDTKTTPRQINYTFTYCPGGRTGIPSK